MIKNFYKFTRQAFSSEQRNSSQQSRNWPSIFILGANIGIFSLYNQEIYPEVTNNLKSHKEFFKKHFTYNPREKFQGYQLLSYGFYHDNLFELGANLAIFLTYAPKILDRFGSKKILSTYLLGVASGALYTAIMYHTGHFTSRSVYGAGAGVSSIAAFYISAFPYEPIFSFLPIPNWAFGLLLLYATNQLMSDDPSLFGGLISGAVKCMTRI